MAARTVVSTMLRTAEGSFTFVTRSSGTAYRRAGPSTIIGSAHNSRALHSTTMKRGPWEGAVNKGAKMNRYLIVAEDYPNAGALARRLEVRDAHLQDAKAGLECGRIELGGGLLSRDFGDIDPESSPVYSISGSVFVVQGENIEDVTRRIKGDLYSEAGVWDPAKVRIFPFLPAFVNAPKIDATPQEQHDAVQRRIPRHTSRARPGNTRRNEVYVDDPRRSGKGINTADRTAMESSLGALRRKFAGVPTANGGKAETSLEKLRDLNKPPVYGQ